MTLESMYGVIRAFYFGPVCKFLEGTVKAREVYLPGGVGGTDFWTGERFEGDWTILADAPLEQIRLFVKAGSIGPVGPIAQPRHERHDTAWGVRLYPGRAGSIEVYEAAGEGHDFENGESAFSPIEWEDGAGELRIGNREGSLPDLVERRDRRVAFVHKCVGTGIEEAESLESITYDGTETSVTPER